MIKIAKCFFAAPANILHKAVHSTQTPLHKILETTGRYFSPMRTKEARPIKIAMTSHIVIMVFVTGTPGALSNTVFEQDEFQDQKYP